jgi:putative ABC transport system permease protein
VSATDAIPATGSAAPPLSLAWRIAFRELRAGIGGLVVFVLCIALGVAAIAGIGSLAAAFEEGLAREGRKLVGGDVSFEVVHRRASAAERAALEAQGAVSEAASLRAMARDASGKTALVEIKAVDDLYPFYGEISFDAMTGNHAPWREPGNVLVERTLLERLGIDIGDRLSIGDASFEIGGILGDSPDKLADRLAYGPRVLMSLEDLARTNLIQPGSLVRWIYRLKLDDVRAGDRQALRAVRNDILTAFPQSGFNANDWTDPAPSVRRDTRRFTQFIGLAGLTALLLGGIGVGNAIGSYMSRKRPVVAIFKCLGASSQLVFVIYLIQTLMLCALGIALGLVLGALMPIGLSFLYADLLPVQLATEPHIRPLLGAALAGLLTTLLFVLWPLGRTRRVSGTVLMRAHLSEEDEHPAWGFAIAAALAGLALFAIAILSSQEPLITTAICAGIVAAFFLFLGAGWAIAKLAGRRRLSRPASLALALASIAGPGSLARAITVSLGVGLSLLVAIALIDRSLQTKLASEIGMEAPAYFFLDVEADEIDAFKGTVTAVEPQAKLSAAPMLRGRILELNGVPAEKADIAPEQRWVLSSDRGLTYADSVPEGSELVAGEWWEPSYVGPPLVSFDEEIAKGLGLGLGDKVTVNILGRNVEAEIASLRKIDWESLAISFVMVFSPNTLEEAPHRMITTLELPPDLDGGTEGKIVQALSERFPLVTAIRVGDIVEAAQRLLGQVIQGIEAIAGLTLIVGAVVLAGAVQSSQQRRRRDAVLYKTLGATRSRILAAHLIEYGLLGIAAASVALLLGSAAAFGLTKWVFDTPFVFSGTAAAFAIFLALALVLGLGGVATWRVLSAKAAPFLRES